MKTRIKHWSEFIGKYLVSIRQDPGDRSTIILEFGQHFAVISSANHHFPPYIYGVKHNCWDYSVEAEIPFNSFTGGKVYQIFVPYLEIAPAATSYYPLRIVFVEGEEMIVTAELGCPLILQAGS